MKFQSEKLRKTRILQGMSISGLAEISKIAAAEISKIERGVTKVPRPATIKCLADALNRPMEEFIDWEDAL